MNESSIRAVHWSADRLCLLDQRKLPGRVEYLEYEQAADVARAIRDMVVRGAPAIGIAAAYGYALAVRVRYGEDPADWREAVARDAAVLGAARPTAVNLGWALARMAAAAARVAGDPVPVALDEARRIHDEDVAANREMGRLGAALLDGPSDVLTHCNAGALATGGYGTALGVIRTGHAGGIIRNVYADETRPWLQGARLTAWELLQDDIPVHLITDAAAAYAMGCGKVQWVIVGADRVAANGDVANKIGTYSLAVLARHHGVGFMVVAPTSTIDPAAASGADIPIETRSPDEVTGFADTAVAAPGAGAWNPVFDVTPAALVDALVTERGVARPPTRESVAALLG